MTATIPAPRRPATTTRPAAEAALPMSRKQRLSVRESSGTVNIWQGAIRSGKTIASLLRWLLYVAMAPTGGVLLIIGRTRDSVIRNVMVPLSDPALFGEMALTVKYSAGSNNASILGRDVTLMGANDAKAERILRGVTSAGAYVDELTIIPEDFFVTLLGRLSVPGCQLFGTTNPDSPAHWLKRKFLDRIAQLAGWRTWRFQLDDNPSLSEGYKRRKRAEFTGLWFRRFILGEWVAAEGAVYGMWDPRQHVIPWAELPHMDKLLGLGVDWGTTNASAALLLGLSLEPEVKLYLVDEWRYDPQLSRRQLTTAQQSQQLRDWLAVPRLPHADDHHLTPRFTFVDPSAAALKTQLHQDGVRAVTNADNDVDYGIPVMAALLGDQDLAVSDRCQGFINEAPGYSWDDKATLDGRDQPVKVADHSLDGGRYAVVSSETYWRPHIRRKDRARAVAA